MERKEFVFQNECLYSLTFSSWLQLLTPWQYWGKRTVVHKQREQLTCLNITHHIPVELCPECFNWTTSSLAEAECNLHLPCLLTTNSHLYIMAIYFALFCFIRTPGLRQSGLTLNSLSIWNWLEFLIVPQPPPAGITGIHHHVWFCEPLFINQCSHLLSNSLKLKM